MAKGSGPKVLLLEDERNVGSTLAERLDDQGFDITWSTTCEEAYLEINNRRFDLAILDVSLPDGSGLDVAKKLRESHRGTAILFLTALGNPEDRIKGLELGAEDYVVKPFHFKELVLRIQNALKRALYLAGSGEQDTVRVGRAQVRFSKFEAEVDGVVTSLTHRECALLKFLVDRCDKVVSRDEILNQVWAEGEFPSPRTIDNFILRLRKLVELDAENPETIKSVRGVGYLLHLGANG